MNYEIRAVLQIMPFEKISARTSKYTNYFDSFSKTLVIDAVCDFMYMKNKKNAKHTIIINAPNKYRKNVVLVSSFFSECFSFD